MMSNIYALFSAHVGRTPDKIALIFEQQQLSYRQLDQQVLTLCSYFRQSGLKTGQRVALFAPNCPEYVVVLLAVARMGLALVPLPISLKGDALIQALKSTPVAAAIAWPTVSKLLTDSNVIAGSPLLTLQKPVGDELSWAQLMHDYSADLQSVPAPDPEAPYILTMTSGSTGQPKPIVLSQRCKIARAFTATVQCYDLTVDDRVLVATPLYHSLAQRGVLMPLMLGACCVILPKFTINAWLRAIETHRISFLFAVSSQLEALLAEPVSSDLSSLRCVVSSSAVLNASSKQQLLQRLPGHFHECYGASEVGVVTDFCISQRPDKNGSVGQALPHVRLKIVDDSQAELAVGQVGEIACHTSTGFSGYLKLPAATAAAYDADGYFLTGDLGYLDQDGFLYYAGRKKELISTGGINVYPQDIEAVIKRHPAVIDCVAFGCPDRQLGEYLKVVYEQKGEDDLSRELRLLCLAELTDYQQPRTISRIAELPRNQMGKVLRKQVKDDWGP